MKSLLPLAVSIALMGPWCQCEAGQEGRMLPQDTLSVARISNAVELTTVPAVGAIVLEASTNLIDWQDVTMVLPQDQFGLFLDNQSTERLCRFYRMRSIASTPNPLISVNNIADLRALSSVSSFSPVLVSGYHLPGDGGGGRFYWASESDEEEDGGMTISSAAAPGGGRWKRIAEAATNVRWFGAVGDAQAADLKAIQAALDYVDRQGGGKVYLPKGVYSLGTGANSPLRMGSDTLLAGDGTASVILSVGGQAIRNKNWDNPNDYGISIQDLAVDCAGRGVNGIILGGVTQGTIHNVTVKNPLGYGIWLVRIADTDTSEGKPTRGVTVSDSRVTGVVDVGIECSGAVGCSIRGNYVTGLRGIGGYFAWNGATDCIFSGNVAEGEGDSNSFVGYAVHPMEFAGSAISACSAISV